MRAHPTTMSLALGLGLGLTFASGFSGTKAAVKKPPARPCPADLEQRLQTMWAENENALEFEVAVIRACVEGRFGAPGWGVVATYGQPDDSQAEIGWTHRLHVVGEDGAVRATADIGGSGWMDGPWRGELQLADFDGDGVDELLFTDREQLDAEGYNPFTSVGVVAVYRVAGDTAEEKLRLRVDLSTEDLARGGGEEEPQEPVFTCKGTWRIIDAAGGRKQLDVVMTAMLQDPRPPEPVDPEAAAEEPDYPDESEEPEEPLWRRYRCAEPGTHRWQLVDGRFSEAG